MTTLGILTIDFQLPGCDSLKQKRQRLSGLKDRFGKRPHIAVSESDYADSLQQAQWQFVVIGPRSVVEPSLTEIERHCAMDVDAVIHDVQREFL